MRFPGRFEALALAVLLMLILALARYRTVAGASRTAPDLVVPTPTAAGVPLKDMLSAHETALIAAVRPAKPRRPRLWDKGEALGGGISDEVDKTTGTPSAR